MLTNPDDEHSVEGYCAHLRALASRRRASDLDDADLELRIKNTIERILSHRRPDGSFSDDRHDYTPVAPTAHALIALAEARYPEGDDVQGSLRYLVRQIRPDGSVRSASDAEESGWPGGPEVDAELVRRLPAATGVRRVQPAALTLIALTCWNADPNAVSRISAFLVDARSRNAWGAYPEARPSPAPTALALYALIDSGTRPRGLSRAASFLRRTQRPEGWWPEEVEMWSVRSAKGTHLDCSIVDTESYALLAMLRLGRVADLTAVRRTLRFLMAEQRLAEQRRAPIANQSPLPEPAPPGNAADEITVTLAKAEPLRSSPLAAVLAWPATRMGA